MASLLRVLAIRVGARQRRIRPVIELLDAAKNGKVDFEHRNSAGVYLKHFPRSRKHAQYRLRCTLISFYRQLSTVASESQAADASNTSDSGYPMAK